MKKLTKDFNSAVEAYLKEFNKKHETDADLNDFVAGDIGTIVCVRYCFMDFENIRHDIDNDIAPKLIWKWYYYSLDKGLANKPASNFKNYCKGVII